MGPENTNSAVGYDSNHNNRPIVGNSYGYRPEVHKACKEEIEALDPRRDDKPIKEFTTSWLTKVKPALQTLNSVRLTLPR